MGGLGIEGIRVPEGATGPVEPVSSPLVVVVVVVSFPELAVLVSCRMMRPSKCGIGAAETTMGETTATKMKRILEMLSILNEYGGMG